MIRTTTLLAVGLLLAGSAPAFAQHPMTPPAKPMHHQHMNAQHMQQQKPVVDSIMEKSTTGRTSADIRHVQTWLKDLKLYDGPVNGVMSSYTHDALKKFQRTHHIPASGMLSDTVMVLLRKAAGQRMGNSP